MHGKKTMNESCTDKIMEKECVFKIMPYVLWRNADKKAIILNRNDTDVYYTLNEVGMEVWMMCTSGKAFGTILKRLSTKYQIKESRIEKDIEELIAEWLKEGLLNIA